METDIVEKCLIKCKSFFVVVKFSWLVKIFALLGTSIENIFIEKYIYED